VLVSVRMLSLMAVARCPTASVRWRCVTLFRRCGVLRFSVVLADALLDWELACVGFRKNAMVPLVCGCVLCSNQNRFFNKEDEKLMRVRVWRVFHAIAAGLLCCEG
jgi:hypothetical protein